MFTPPLVPLVLPTELDGDLAMSVSVSLPKSLRRLRTYTQMTHILSRDGRSSARPSDGSCAAQSGSTRRRPLSSYMPYSSSRLSSGSASINIGCDARSRLRRRSSSRSSFSSGSSSTSSDDSGAPLVRQSAAVQVPTPPCPYPYPYSNPSPNLDSHPTAAGGEQPSTTTAASTAAISATSNPPSLLSSSSSSSAAPQQIDTMARARAATTGDASAAAAVSAATNSASSSPAAANSSDTTPSIRFSTYFDSRSTRPSLSFPAITRSLPRPSDVIRVGRYSEKDSQLMSNAPGNQPSAAPVGFKSKVVSRRHCEFWCEDGKWYIRDVKSSSGTFLNHIRLSPPSQESKAFPINDGDIIQLGIDFKGGEEMIYRCVKMRVELNRGWQTKLNTFNMAAHKRLRTMATNGGGSASGNSSQDCSICLNSIAPCQSLFVAPCSHTWHFKCVKALLMGPQYPVFLCPNCRAGADLEADVDEPTEDWQQMDDESDEVDDSKIKADEPVDSNPAPPTATSACIPEDSTTVPRPVDAGATLRGIDAMDSTILVSSPDVSLNGSNPAHVPSTPVPIMSLPPGSMRAHGSHNNRTPSPPQGSEGPLTPRNDAGPWVFDGTAGDDGSAPDTGMRSLDAAAALQSHGMPSRG
ncbi:hypothetical protein S40293_00891 [Stachybotrys chartarum IBT 40293]|nr:hypothetical protein S40293_00891 [Stachybotrys chartarum IBT 40293]